MDVKALEIASQSVLDRFSLTNAKCVLILGSGWSQVAESFDLIDSIPYADIPGMGKPGVAGHAGCLRHCRVENETILIFQGRRHWYEGEGWTPVAIPVYIAKRVQAQTALLTNAAGGISPELIPGSMMMISDHINAMGANPLVGPHHRIWGERFPDQSSIYSKHLQQLLLNAASASNTDLKQGIYLATSGPTYETPAEVRTYRNMGADAVGMSTVPEAMLANAAGLDVAGISCITNFAAGVSQDALGHEEVLQTTQRVMPVMTELIRQFVIHVCTAPA
jgi:purine-nucleoside phosphorylase